MKNKALLFLILCSITISCSRKPEKQEATEEMDKTAAMDAKPMHNTQVASEWMSLMQPDSFDGWHIYQNESGEKGGWSVENGVFVFDSGKATGEGDKSLMTDKEYTDFVFYVEWKVSEGANSGIMWGVKEDAKFSNPYITGPEIQIIDPNVYKNKPDQILYDAGALYDLKAPEKMIVKPAGEWNSYEITINHKTNEGKVSINGENVLSFPLAGQEWEAMVAKSKFKDWEGFGDFATGKICLQDHPGVISFRNIKIKTL